MVSSHHQTDNCSIGPSNKINRSETEIVHHSDHIRFHELVAVGSAVSSAATMSAAVDGQHLAVLGDFSDLQTKIFGVSKSAVQEDDRGARARVAGAENRVPDLHTIHIQEARRVRGGEGGRIGESQPWISGEHSGGHTGDQEGQAAEACGGDHSLQPNQAIDEIRSCDGEPNAGLARTDWSKRGAPREEKNPWRTDVRLCV